MIIISKIGNIEFQDLIPHLVKLCEGKNFLFIDEVPLAKWDRISRFSLAGKYEFTKNFPN